MTELAEHKNGLARALLAYCGVFVFTQVLVFVITYYFDFDNPAMGLIIIMAASLAAGNVFAAHTKRLPSRGEKFKFGFLATICSLVLAYVALWAMFQWYGLPFNKDMIAFALAGGNMNQAQDVMEILPIVLGIVAVLNLLLGYFFLGMGAKQTVKQQAKMAG
ncbi:ABZJ_00895 family protein [Neogemmobacter tilapiae]|uniref:DUF4199 domain-containing protein n=1 Tax=Neogemmobacter tilapiae TaxID=875041 RepID=A0A918TMT2_9RHOB|nr:ABZJ_00895 family protein [Gemmobacter tilapiae]GHC53945.1 hypothetical protein GCM10007315_15920 [Gemmobacter tilapiae]